MIRLSQFLVFHYSQFSNIQILCWRTDLRSNVEHLAVLKLLITKLTKANRVNQVISKLTNPNGVNQVITKLTNPKLKSISATISAAENHGKTATTENHEGHFLLFAHLNLKYNIVLVQKSGYSSSQATSTSSL